MSKIRDKCSTKDMAGGVEKLTENHQQNEFLKNAEYDGEFVNGVALTSFYNEAVSRI